MTTLLLVAFTENNIPLNI